MKNINGTCNELIHEFTENYMEKLFYFFLKRCSDNIVAEELTHDVALDIITQLNKGVSPECFSAWVWQIARNCYSKWVNEKRRRNESLTGGDIGDYELESDGENLLDKMITTEQMSFLRRELALIKSDYRNILVAYYIENAKLSDIASSLSISISAAQQRLHRARITLKEGMEMAREFGKLSFKPENMDFIGNGFWGRKGEPWNYLERSVCKNIILAAYKSPQTAEELSIELGIALPYMEEELQGLVDCTLVKKNGRKYQSNILIISAEVQGRIYNHLNNITPELTEAIIESLEYEVNWKNENSHGWSVGEQPYEDMKWALLMLQTDAVNFDVLRKVDAESNILNLNLGKSGHTIRSNGGEWDVIGMEIYNGTRPNFVGLHGCMNSPDARDLPMIDFKQFKFKYQGIEFQTPEFLDYEYARALCLISEDKSEEINSEVLRYLAENGYIKKCGESYKPAFLVTLNNCKNTNLEASEEFRKLRRKAVEIADRHYKFCRNEIYKEIPRYLQKDIYQIEHACANMFNMRGAVLEEALRIGYISYHNDGEKRMLGTVLTI